MGTPQLACASLDMLVGNGNFEVIGVVTQPDRPKGRDLRLTASPVKALAQRHGIKIWQPLKARDEQFLQTLQEAQPDLIVVAAFGQILPTAILDLPRFGCLNVHTSLLPKYRGAAPIQWAILNGDSETGITIMRMDAGLDTGPILAQKRIPILEQDDAQILHDRLAEVGAELLAQTIPGYLSGDIPILPQPSEGASYARKIAKSDGELNWKRPARELWNQIRGLVPWPGSFTYCPALRPGLLKIWSAEVSETSGIAGEILNADKSGIVVGCGEKALRVLSLQREGARRLTPQQFLAGTPLHPGQRLGL
jgi:methionyl-tRNA formyltransferase